MSKAPLDCGDLVTIAKCSSLILQTSSQEHTSPTLYSLHKLTFLLSVFFHCVTTESAYPPNLSEVMKLQSVSIVTYTTKGLGVYCSVWKTK